MMCLTLKTNYVIAMNGKEWNKEAISIIEADCFKLKTNWHDKKLSHRK